MRMILPSDWNACLRTLRVDRKQAMSLSQPLCTYHNKGSHMLSIIDTWGRMQYFFKSCFAIVTTGFCSVSLTRMHWDPPPQQIKQSYTRATMHWYTTSNRGCNFFPSKDFGQIARWRLVWKPQMTYMYITSVNKAFFPDLKIGFMLVL